MDASTTRIDYSDRKGDWGQAHSGRRFYPADPRVEDVDMSDITWALSHENRYGGHTNLPYSVLQHSLHVGQYIEEQHPLDPLAVMHGLLHDAHEAYLKDIPRPLKAVLGNTVYPGLENRWDRAIHAAIGLKPLVVPPDRHHPVHVADAAILATERRDIFPNGVHENWRLSTAPWGRTIKPLPPNDVRMLFTQMFMKYAGMLWLTVTVSI